MEAGHPWGRWECEFQVVITYRLEQAWSRLNDSSQSRVRKKYDPHHLGLTWLRFGAVY
jgi:hypothetical protein